MSNEQTKAGEWGILELLGHRRLGGLVTEVERFGTKCIRIDVPDTKEGADPDAYVLTQFYSPAAFYAFTPSTEAVARAEAKWHQPQPVALLSPPPAAENGDPEDDDRMVDPRDGEG